MQTAYSLIDMSFSKAKIPKKEAFRVTMRDIDILEFILEMKFSTIEDIHTKFFKLTKDGEQSFCLRWARERISNLVKTDFLNTVKDVCHRTLYIVTSKGYFYLRNSRPDRDYSKPLLSVDGRTYDHDQKVIQVRLTLEQTGLIKKWISERQLSELEEFRKYLPTEFRPDAIYETNDGLKVAFELEIARKSKERYHQKVKRYIQLTWRYFKGDKGSVIMNQIRNLFTKNDFRVNDRIRLGKVIGSLWRQEELTEGQLNHHVHVVGASGYGKTVFISHIIKQRIETGKGLLFIDLKADMDSILKFSQYAVQADRAHDLRIFSLTDKAMSLPYNLILDGTATQLRDRIVNSLNWSEEYYKNQSSSFLLKLLILLCWLRDNKKKGFHLGIILDCATNIKKLVEIGNEIPLQESKLKTYAQNLKDFLESKENFNSLQGLRTQIESIVISDFGDLVSTNDPGIDMFEAATSRKIIFIFLDTRRYSETAKAIGRFILQDLKSVSARVDAEIPKEKRKPFSVVIDEFADLAQEDFISFLDRARSSKMSVVVAHQEICDLERISPEFAGRLMGNTSTLYAFLQKRPESAEIISGMAGTRKAWKETVQSEKFFGVDVSTGKKSLREVEEFNIHPNTIKSLRVGKCVCIKKYPQSRAYLVDVNPQ